MQNWRTSNKTNDRIEIFENDCDQKLWALLKLDASKLKRAGMTVRCGIRYWIIPAKDNTPMRVYSYLN